MKKILDTINIARSANLNVSRHTLRCAAYGLMLSSGLLAGMMSTAQARPYLGADIGQSTLEPDASATDFRLSEDTGTGFNVHGGFVFSEKLAAELRYFDLGNATLDSTNSEIKAEVDYSGFGLSAAYYFPRYFDHWTVFGRVGAAALSTSANVPVEKDSDISPWFGLGTQLHIGGGMLLRAQYDSYAEDAQQLSLGISKFWGGGKESEEIEEAPIGAEEAELDLYTATNKPFALNPIADADRTDSASTQDGDLANADDDALDDALSAAADSDAESRRSSLLLDRALDDTMAGDSTAPKGVFHKSNAIASLYFTIGSSELSPESQQQLQAIQQEYVSTNSTQQVIFVGHTCDIGHDGNNEQLSLIRAATAQQYLVSLGVTPEKTKATAFGAKSPKFINDSEENRRENRRVDVFYQVPSLLERLNGLE